MNLIQFNIIWIALLTIDIVTKQVYRNPNLDPQWDNTESNHPLLGDPGLRDYKWLQYTLWEE